MKKQETDQLNQMRLNGIPPSAIARELGLSVNTVKSYIRRHPELPNIRQCLYCGNSVAQHKGRKQKKFCSDRCRITYWNHRYREEDRHGRDKES